MQTTETATGKILLSGEHSVVYGQPALVSSVDVGLSVTINDQKKTQHHDVYTAHILHIFSQVNNIDVSKITITTESQMKSKSGMGSSAAYAFALLKSLHSFFEISVTADQLFEQVLKAETFVHVHPSGVDPAAVVYGGIQVFQKTPNGFLRTHLQLAEPITFHCVYSGKAEESTGEMVAAVARLHAKNDCSSEFKEMGKITTELVHQLERGDLDGELLTQNNQLLKKIGVVGEKAQKMITQIENWGGFAKITGAGGVREGSGWILVYAPEKWTVEKIAGSGWETFTSTVQ